MAAEKEAEAEAENLEPTYHTEKPEIAALIKKGYKLIQKTKGNKAPVELRQILLDNGAVYKGEWTDGKRCGQGKQRWPDGSCYSGVWANNMANGKGKLIHPDLDVYEGDWVDDKANGDGVYTHANQAKYIG